MRILEVKVSLAGPGSGDHNSGIEKRRMKSKRNTASRMRGLAGLMGAVISVGLLIAAPAHAATGTAHASTPRPSSPANPRLTAAAAQARRGGKPIQVSALTTANSTTVANPNGSFTVATTVMPTRMKTSTGAWVNLNPTLIRRRGGSITTTATPDSLTLSGGGTGPVISVTDGAGHSLALTLPVTLPAPAIRGASATYASVYPGISLTVTAQPAGGFSEVFTIADASAARQAAHLRFGTTLRGLTLARESSGVLQARDSKTGVVIMTAPPAALWDSATARTTGTQASPAQSQAAATDASKANTDPYFRDSRGSSAAGPGLAAHTMPLRTTLAGGGLTLSADPAALGVKPVYPLYADPTWSSPSASGGALNYDEAQAGCPSAVNYDSVTDLGVGYNEFDSVSGLDCIGAYESFMTVSLSGLNSSDRIASSDFKITSDYSAYNACKEGSQTVDLDWTGTINSGTDWSDRPGPLSNSSVPAPMSAENVQSDGNAAGGTCAGGVPVDFPITSRIAYFAGQNAASITVGMYGNESAGPSLERFNEGTAVLDTTYDLPPSAPASVTASPTPVRNGASWPCGGSSAPGYLPITNVSGQNVATLSATATSPVAGAQMYGVFTVTNMTTSTTTTLDSTGYVTSGGTVSVQTPTLISGDEYTWSVYLSDQYLTSPASPTCAFIAEQDPPGNPSISSTSYPAVGSGSTSTLVAGDSGTFTLKSAEPSGGPGLTGFYYSLNSPVPASGASLVGLDSGSTTSATLSLTPGTWGTNVLYAQARDAAGNVSAQATYQFYVPWSPGSAKTLSGSVNGGGAADLVVTDSSGDLVEYPANATPGTAPVQLSPGSASPGSSGSWSNFQVTHYGSYDQHPGFDDLWALNTSTHNLYLVFNNQSSTGGNYAGGAASPAITKSDVALDNGSTTACYATSTAPDSCASYDNTNWGETTQILAAGDFYAGSPDASALDTTKSPGLLTVENGSLWYYQGQQGPFYLGTAIQLGTSGWNDFTLLAPGAVNGADVIWARDNATGVVYQYPISYDAAGYPVSLGTPTSGSGTALAIPVAGGLTSAQYPAIYAADLHGTGDPDLIAQTANGVMTDWPGSAATSAGLATFGSPVALGNDRAAAGAVTFASDGTIYPTGSTWSNPATTMSFTQGVLTVTSTSTGALLGTYGSGPDPDAYLVLQSDGNLDIYNGTPGGNTVIWSSGTGGNSGDTMKLQANGLLVIDASNGTQLWMTGDTSAVAGSATFAVAGNTSSGALWTWSTVGGAQVLAQGVEPGTSPAIAALSTGGYEVAWAASGTDDLYLTGPGGTTNTGLAMNPGSSPAITATASGGFEVAYQSSGTDLCYYGGTEVECTDLGMYAGTCPVITTLASGQVEAAFEANTTNLWFASQQGNGSNTGLGMYKGTSPSVTALSDGDFEAAFEANTSQLWIVDSLYSAANPPLGMDQGTNPSIIQYGGGLEIGFTANTSILWITDTVHSITTGPVAGTTSPALVALSGGYEAAWAGVGSDATLYSSATGGVTSLGQQLSAGSSPAIAGPSTVIG